MMKQFILFCLLNLLLVNTLNGQSALSREWITGAGAELNSHKTA